MWRIWYQTPELGNLNESDNTLNGLQSMAYLWYEFVVSVIFWKMYINGIIYLFCSHWKLVKKKTSSFVYRNCIKLCYNWKFKLIDLFDHCLFFSFYKKIGIFTRIKSWSSFCSLFDWLTWKQIRWIFSLSLQLESFSFEWFKSFS